MNIRYLYFRVNQDINKEKVSTLICEYVSTLLDIPDNIEILFDIMDNNVYGSSILNHRFKNRISINNTLTTRELPYVLTHELIHLNQLKNGLLNVSSSGQYIWNKRYYYVDNNMDHRTLPWEQDVEARIKPILNKTLEYLSTTVF